MSQIGKLQSHTMEWKLISCRHNWIAWSDNFKHCSGFAYLCTFFILTEIRRISYFKLAVYIRCDLLWWSVIHARTNVECAFSAWSLDETGWNGSRGSCIYLNTRCMCTVILCDATRVWNSPVSLTRPCFSTWWCSKRTLWWGTTVKFKRACSTNRGLASVCHFSSSLSNYSHTRGKSIA